MGLAAKFDDVGATASMGNNNEPDAAQAAAQNETDKFIPSNNHPADGDMQVEVDPPRRRRRWRRLKPKRVGFIQMSSTIPPSPPLSTGEKVVRRKSHPRFDNSRCSTRPRDRIGRENRRGSARFHAFGQLEGGHRVSRRDSHAHAEMSYCSTYHCVSHIRWVVVLELGMG